MRKRVQYECEFCEQSFDTKEECDEHEKTHIRNYEEANNEEIADLLEQLSAAAYGYRFGETVMGIPRRNFENALSEAAKRLRKM